MDLTHVQMKIAPTGILKQHTTHMFICLFLFKDIPDDKVLAHLHTPEGDAPRIVMFQDQTDSIRGIYLTADRVFVPLLPKGGVTDVFCFFSQEFLSFQGV